MTEPKLTPTTNDALAAGPVVPPGAAVVAPPMFAFPGPMAQRNPLMPKKVAILGTQPASRMVAPFNDPEWTIWGSSPGNMNILPRVDAWFEMHVNLLWEKYKAYGKPYIHWLNEQTFPVVAIDNRFVPRAIRYPIEEMLLKFGQPLPYFFSSTFAYMMAFAISLNVEEMGLYGVDMSSKDEYALQRSGGHFFIVEAFKRGIKVRIPPESDLGQPPPLYGYADDTYYARKNLAREDETTAQMTAIEQQINQLQQKLIYLRGAHENQVYNRQVYGSVDQITFNGFDGTNGMQYRMPFNGSGQQQQSAAGSGSLG